MRSSIRERYDTVRESDGVRACVCVNYVQGRKSAKKRM